MTTYRVAKRTKFTMIDRRALNDARLSFRARGVLAYILDKEDGWTFDSETISSAGKEGRDAVRAALRELAECGYLVQERVQLNNGRWTKMTNIYEVPPKPENPSSVDPSPKPGNPASVNQALIPKTETEDYKSSKTSSSPPRKRDLLWDAVVGVCGQVSTRSETSKRAKAVSELRAIGATPQQVPIHHENLRRLWGGRIVVTDTALVANWSKGAPRTERQRMLNGAIMDPTTPW